MKEKIDVLPLVSFIIPTFNAEEDLHRCLRSIRSQKYPKGRIEIIISDGGSFDNTLEIAKKYNCKIIRNKKKLPDPGVALGLKIAKGDISFIFGADNDLPRKNWITLMITPFVNVDVYGVFTHVINDKTDPLITRYINLLHADPFTWFVYGNEVHPKRMHKSYRISKKTKDYKIFEFNTENCPLVGFTQGFGVRKNFIRRTETEYDDMLPVIDMINQGLKIAYVPKAGIYHHHHLLGYSHFIKKFYKRLALNLTTKIGYLSRKKNFSKRRKVRQYLQFLYSFSILPFIDGIKGFIKDKDIAWIIHPVMCLSFSILIITTYIKFNLWVHHI